MGKHRSKEMMRKAFKLNAVRAQVSYFMVIALVLLLISITFFSFQEKMPVQQRTTSIAAAQSFIDACLKEVSKEGIVYIGLRGGYYRSPLISLNGTAIYFFKNGILVPSQEQIQKELSDYVVDNLADCLDDFSDFSAQGKAIEQGAIAAQSSLTQDGVIVQIDMPTVLSESLGSEQQNRFIVKIGDVRIKMIHGIAGNITANQHSKVSFCASCLADVAFENKVNIDIHRTSETEYVFVITDAHSMIDSTPYQFRFVHKFEKINCNSIPSYLSPDDKEMIGQICSGGSA